MDQIGKNLLEEITKITGRTFENCGINEILKICIEELKDLDMELAHAKEILEDRFGIVL